MESGSLKITSGYEGIDASGAVEITGGTTDITSGDGSGKTLSSSDVSTKGVKSSADILISGGEVSLENAYAHSISPPFFSYIVKRQPKFNLKL